MPLNTINNAEQFHQVKSPTDSKVQVLSSIGVAIGVIIALGGIFTLLAIAYPHAFGPLNALTNITNIGGAILTIAGSAVVIVAIKYLCQSPAKQKLSEQAKQEIDQVKTPDFEKMSYYERRESEMQYNLQLRNLVVKYHTNPAALQYFITKYANEIGILAGLLDIDNKLACKALMDAIRCQPEVFNQVIEQYFMENNGRGFPWHFLHDLTEEEVAQLTHAIYMDDKLVDSRFQSIGILALFNHAQEQEVQQFIKNMTIFLTQADVQKIYQSLIDNCPKVDLGDGKFGKFHIRIRKAADEFASHSTNDNDDSMTIVRFLKRDFEKYFSGSVVV